MTLAQRMKLGAAGPLSKVQNLGTYNKKPAKIQEDDPRWDCKTMGNKKCGPAKRVMIEVKKSPQKATPRQYGDKGYKPSNGKGVGY